jgi:hypothetical protein
MSSDGFMHEELRLRARDINFDSTISRQLVHRNFIDHVLVTDVVRMQDDRFLCGARLPQSHIYFNEIAGNCSGILLGTEMMRQSSIALSHKFLGVSPSFSYILQHVTNVVERLGPRTITRELCNVILDIQLTDRTYRRSGELTGLVADIQIYSGDQRVMRGGGEFMFVPKKMYERLRRSGGNGHAGGNGSDIHPIPIAPEQVGRRELQNVVITSVTQREPDLFEAHVVVDPEHPYFFEHKLDHVSGMLLLEACNQVGIAATARWFGFVPREIVFKSFDAHFHEFAALGELVKVTARVLEHAAAPFDGCALTLDVHFTQNGHPLAECRVGMAAVATLEPLLVSTQRVTAGSERA